MMEQLFNASRATTGSPRKTTEQLFNGGEEQWGNEERAVSPLLPIPTGLRNTTQGCVATLGSGRGSGLGAQFSFGLSSRLRSPNEKVTTPSGLGRRHDSQPRVGPTLGWQTQSRWDWGRNRAEALKEKLPIVFVKVHEVRPSLCVGYPCQVIGMRTSGVYEQ